MAEEGIGDAPNTRRSRDHFDDGVMSTSTASIDSSLRGGRADIQQYLEIGKSLQHLRKSVFDMYRNEIKNSPAAPAAVNTNKSSSQHEEGKDFERNSFPPRSNVASVAATAEMGGPVVGDTAVVKRKESAKSNSAVKTPSISEALQSKQSIPAHSFPDGAAVSSIHPSSSRRRAEWENDGTNRNSRGIDVTPAALYNEYDGSFSPRGGQNSGFNNEDDTNEHAPGSPSRLNKSITDLVSQHEEKYKTLAKEVGYWRQRSTVLESKLEECDKSYSNKLEAVIHEQDSISEQQHRMLKELSNALVHTAAINDDGKKKTASPSTPEDQRILRESLDKLNRLLDLTAAAKSRSSPSRRALMEFQEEQDERKRKTRSQGRNLMDETAGDNASEDDDLEELRQMYQDVCQQLRLVLMERAQLVEELAHTKNTNATLQQQLKEKGDDYRRSLREMKDEFEEHMSSTRKIAMQAHDQEEETREALLRRLRDNEKAHKLQLKELTAQLNDARSDVAAAKEATVNAERAAQNVRVALDRSNQDKEALQDKLRKVQRQHKEFGRAEARHEAEMDALRGDYEARIAEHRRMLQAVQNKESMYPLQSSVERLETSEQRIAHDYEVAKLRDTLMEIEESEAKLEKDYLALQRESREELRRFQERAEKERSRDAEMYTRELASLRKELQTLRKQADHNYRLKVSNESDLDSARTEMLKADEALNRLREQNASLSSQMDGSEKHITELEGKLAAKTRETQILQATVEELQSVKSDLEKQIIDGQMSRDSLRNELHTVEVELRELYNKEIDRIMGIHRTVGGELPTIKELAGLSASSSLKQLESPSTKRPTLKTSPSRDRPSGRLSSFSFDAQENDEGRSVYNPPRVDREHMSKTALESLCNTLWMHVPNAVTAAVSEKNQLSLRLFNMEKEVADMKSHTDKLNNDYKRVVEEKEKAVKQMQHDVQHKEASLKTELQAVQLSAAADLRRQAEDMRNELEAKNNEIEQVSAMHKKDMEAASESYKILTDQLEAVAGKLKSVEDERDKLYELHNTLEETVKSKASEILNEVNSIATSSIVPAATSSTSPNNKKHSKNLSQSKSDSTHYLHYRLQQHFGLTNHEGDKQSSGLELLEKAKKRLSAKCTEIAKGDIDRREAEVGYDEAMRAFLESINVSFQRNIADINSSMVDIDSSDFAVDHINMSGSPIMLSPVKKNRSLSGHLTRIFANVTIKDEDTAREINSLDHNATHMIHIMNQMQQQVLKKESDVKLLKNQLRDAKQEASYEKSLKDQFMKKSADLQTAADSAAIVVADAQKMRSAMERVHTLEIEKSNAERTASDQENKCKRAEAQVDRLTRSLDDRQQELANLQASFSKMLQDRSTTAENLASANVERQQALAALEEMKSTFSDSSNRIQRLQDSLNQQQVTQATLESNNTVLTEKLQATERKATALQLQLDERNQQLSALSERCNSVVSNESIMKEQVAHTEKQLTEISMRMESAVNDVEHYRKEAQSIRMAKNELETTLSVTQDQLDVKRLQVAQLERRVTTLSGEVDSKSSELEGFNSLVTELTELRKLKVQLSTTNAELGACKEECSELLKQREGYIEDMNELKQSTKRFESLLSEADGLIKELQSQLEEEQRQLAAARRELQTARAENANNQEQLVQYQQLNTSSASQVAVLDSDNTELKAKFVRKCEEVEILKEQFQEERSSTIKAFKEEVSEYETALQLAETQQKEMEREYDDLREDFDTVTAEVSELKALVDSKKKEIDDKNVEIKLSMERLNASILEKDAAADALRRNQSELDQLQDEHSSLKIENEASQQELQKLKLRLPVLEEAVDSLSREKALLTEQLNEATSTLYGKGIILNHKEQSMADLLAKLNTLERSESEAATMLEALKMQYQQSESQCVHFREDLQQARKEIVELQAQLREKDILLEDIRNNASLLQTTSQRSDLERTNLTEKIIECNKKIQDMQKEILEKVEICTEKDMKLKETSEQLSNMIKAHEQMQQVSHRMTGELEASRKEISSLKSESDAKDATITELQRMIKDETDKAAQNVLHNELLVKELEGKKNSANDRLDETLQQLHECRKELAEAEQLQKLQLEEWQDIKVDNENLMNMLRASEAEKEKLIEKNMALMQESKDNTARYTTADKELLELQRENDLLGAQFNKQQEEIEALTKERNFLSTRQGSDGSQLQSLRMTVRELRNLNDSLEREAAESKARADRADAALDDLMAKERAASEHLRTALSTRSTVEGEQEEMRRELISTSSRLKDCELEITSLKRDAAESSVNLVRAEAELKALQKELSITTKYLEDNTKKNEQLQQINTSLEQQVQAHTSHITKANAEVADARRQLTFSEEERQSNKEKIKALENDIDELQRRMIAVSTDLGASKANAETNSTELLRTQLTLESTQRELEVCMSDLRSAREDVEKIRSERASLAQQASSSTETIGTLKADLESKSNSLAQMADNMASMKKELADLKVRDRTAQSLEVENTALKSELADVRNQLDKTAKDRLENSWLTEKNRELRASMEAFESRANLFGDEHQTNRRQLDDYRRQISTLEDKCTSLNRELGQRSDEVDELRAVKKKLEHDLLNSSTAVRDGARLEADNSSLRRTIKDLEGEVMTRKNSEIKLETELREHSSISRELATVKRENAALQKQLEEVKVTAAEESRYRLQLDAQRHETNTARRELADVKMENERLQNRLRNIQFEIELIQQQQQLSSHSNNMLLARSASFTPMNLPVPAGYMGAMPPATPLPQQPVSSNDSDAVSKAMTKIYDLLNERDSPMKQQHSATLSEAQEIELAGVRQENENLQKQLAKMDGRLAKMKLKLETENQHLIAAEEEKETLRLQLKEVQQKMKDMKSKLRSRGAELATVAGEAEEHKQQLTRLESKYGDDLLTHQNRATEAQDRLRAAEDQHRSQIDSMEKKLSQLQIEYDMTASEKEKHQLEAKQSQHNLMDVHNQLAAAKRQHEVDAKSIELLQKRLDEQSKHISDQLGSHNQSTSALTAQLADHQKRGMEWEQRYHADHGLLSNVLNRLVHLSEFVDKEVGFASTPMSESADDLQAQPILSVRNLTFSVPSTPQVKGKIKDKNGEFIRPAVESLVGHMEATYSQLSQLNKDLAVSHKTRLDLESQVKKLEQEIIQLTGKHSHVWEEHQQLHGELSSKKNLLDEMESKMKRFERDSVQQDEIISALKASNSELELMCDTVNTELQEALKRLEESENNERRQHQMANLLREQLDQVQAEMEPMRQQVSSMSKQLAETDDLPERVTRQALKNEELQKQVSLWSSRCEEAENELISNKSAIVDLGRTMRGVHLALDDLAKELQPQGDTESSAVATIAENMKTDEVVRVMGEQFYLWRNNLAKMKMDFITQSTSDAMKDRFIEDLQTRIHQYTQEAHACILQISQDLDGLTDDISGGSKQAVPHSLSSHRTSPGRAVDSIYQDILHSVEDLRLQYGALGNGAKEQVQSRRALTVELSKLKTDLKASNGRAQQLELELETTKQELHILRKHQQAGSAKEQTEVSLLTERTNELQQELRRCLRERTELKQALEEAQVTINQMQSEVTTVVEQMDRSKQSWQAMEEQYQVSLTQKDAALAEKEQKLRAAEIQCEALYREHEELQRYKNITVQRIRDFDDLLVRTFQHSILQPTYTSRRVMNTTSAISRSLAAEADLSISSPNFRQHQNDRVVHRSHSSPTSAELMNTEDDHLSLVLDDFHRVLKEQRRLKRLCSSQQLCILSLRLLLKESGGDEEKKTSYY